MSRATVPAAARRHREVLVVVGLVVVLSLLLDVRADDRVAVAGLAGYPLPPLCMSRAWFGVKCPGCGLTRSLVHLAHGRWLESWQAHRLGGLMAAVILFQFPYRVAALRRGRAPLGPAFARAVGRLLTALLVANWLWDVLARLLAAGGR